MNTGNQIILYRTLINAIEQTLLCLDAIEGALGEDQYCNHARGMVRGISVSIQALATEFGQNENELHGSLAWAYILLMRDFDRKDIDDSIKKASENARSKLVSLSEEHEMELVAHPAELTSCVAERKHK